MKTSTISARIDPSLKQQTERIFKELGLTSSQAITLFYKQVELHRGLPFVVRIPNDATIQALDDARTRNKLETFDTAENLFGDLGI